MCVCVCVCVCPREQKERERKKEKERVKERGRIFDEVKNGHKILGLFEQLQIIEFVNEFI